ncbi:MAG: FkbM family methyltransferase [Alphaproteobacteria bacterium]
MLSGQDYIRVRNTRHGLMMYAVNDVYIGRSLDRYGESSEIELAALRRMIQPGQVVLDIGSNIGTHTLAFAEAVGPTGMVVAVEPQRRIFQMMCGNVALNAVPNVTAYWAAAGAHRGWLHVPVVDYGKAGNYGGLALGEWSQGDRVPVLTIDELGLPACHLIKIDVQGMERDVLTGAVHTIERYRPILYVENDRRENSPALLQQVFDLGYRAYWHRPALFNPNNYLLNPENIFGNLCAINVLCLPAAVRADVGLPEVVSTDAWVGGLWRGFMPRRPGP